MKTTTLLLTILALSTTKVIPATVALPTVSTLNAGSITTTSAVVYGQVTSASGIIERRFEWGTNPSAPDKWTSNVSVNGSKFQYSLSGLAPNTTYYFRAWAKNGSTLSKNGLKPGWALGSWLSFRTSAVAYTKAELTSPTPGSTLQSASQNFSWTAGSGALEYSLYVGSSQGQSNYYSTSTGTSRSQTVSGLPTNGSTIYVRLYTRFANGWFYNDYTYRAATVQSQTKAELTSPTPGSTLQGASQNFSWTSGSGALEYHIYAGSSPGAYNYYGKSTGTSRSQTIAGLPTNGSTIYVRLHTRFASGWLYNDYTYLAATTAITRAEAGYKGPSTLGNSSSSRIVSRMSEMFNVQWVPNANFVNWRLSGSTGSYTKGTRYYGLPYTQAPPAGVQQTDVTGFTRYLPAMSGTLTSTTSAGVDCSGSISIAWELPRRHGTGDFDGSSSYFTTVVQPGALVNSAAKIQPGDAINSSKWGGQGNGHVVLVVSAPVNAKVECLEAAAATEATQQGYNLLGESQRWAVVRRTWSLSDLDAKNCRVIRRAKLQ